jgi:hypothetical protein
MLRMVPIQSKGIAMASACIVGILLSKYFYGMFKNRNDLLVA